MDLWWDSWRVNPPPWDGVGEGWVSNLFSGVRTTSNRGGGLYTPDVGVTGTRAPRQHELQHPGLKSCHSDKMRV